MPDVAEIRRILPVPLQEHAVPGKGVDPRIEGGERPQGSEDEIAIMHHAMRMAVGLRFKFLRRLRLEARTGFGDGALVRPADECGGQRQQDQQREGDDGNPVAAHQPQFIARDQ